MNPKNKRDVRYFTKAADGGKIMFSRIPGNLTDMYGESINDCNRNKRMTWRYQTPGKLV